MKIVIEGQTPSQKNSKITGRNKYSGKTFFTSNQRVKDWQKSALEQLQTVKQQFTPPIRIDYMFFVNDDTQRDLDNMMASVNDILQKANAETKLNDKGKEVLVKHTGMIWGDHWQVLKIGSADAAIDRENPRAEITITEL